ncbi:type II toxin-antitoxin system VapC family toxin [Hymenobacter sp. BRD67]|uniref:type II toxin-antitoxin system VapC family toxin n=1 Tax=Hymenobacter sp. BRD67 TaxID=2675877 RepID=UPI001564A5DD|nr:PIN domain-containing protein [Hymenobacter sp. BRD67]QKG51280.1 PIN domain-containing protein [Hymenobacter sp. BRD67]
MKHYFVDTNVLLDFLIQREPFGAETLQLFEAGARGLAKLYVSSLSFSHIYYALRKTNPAPERIDKLLKLARLVHIIPVDRNVLEEALQLGFADFEDGIQYSAALAVAAVAAIVTRDPKGFSASQLHVLSPAEALRRVT